MVGQPGRRLHYIPRIARGLGRGARLGVVKRGSLGAFILGFAFVISDIAALVTGLVSIIKTKERSILAFLAVVITVLLTLFGLWMFISEEFLG